MEFKNMLFYIGEYLVKRLSGIDTYKVGHLLSPLEDCSPPRLQGFESCFPLAFVEHLWRCVQENHKVRLGIEIAQEPVLDTRQKRLLLNPRMEDAGGSLECEVAIVYYDVASRQVTQGNELAIQSLC
jgi:hypothetical protein